MVSIRLCATFLLASILMDAVFLNAAGDEIHDFEKASQYYKAKNYTYALKSIESAISIDPSNELFWDLKGDILHAMKKSSDAKAAYDRALSMNPGQVDIRHKKCRVLYEEADYDRCIECCRSNLERKPNYGPSKDLEATARTKYGMKTGNDYKLEKGFKGDKNQTEFWKIMDILNSSLEINPNSTSAWNCMGILFGEAEEYSDSITCFEKVLKISSKQNATLNSTLAAAWNNIGVSLDRDGRHENSTDYYDRAISLDPLLAEAWHNRCMTMRLNMSRYFESKEDCRKARELNSALGTEFVQGVYKEII